MRAASLAALSMAATFGVLRATPSGAAGPRALQPPRTSAVALRRAGRMLRVDLGRGRSLRLALDTIVAADGGFGARLLDVQSDTGGRRSVLLYVTGASNTRNPGGFCGAGDEAALVWLQVDAAARVRSARTVTVRSCRTSVDTDVATPAFRGDSLAVPFYSARDDQEHVVRYVRSAPALGLQVATPRRDRRTPGDSVRRRAPPCD